MPNWCSNNLTISGDVTQVAKFKAWLGEEPLTLQKIKPMPSELEDTISPPRDEDAAKAKELIEKYGAADWYSWHVENWGTKWDIEADFDDASSTDDCLIFNFESAWSPPTQAIAALGELFPNLSLALTYREDGCLFAGCLRVCGEDVHDEYVDGGKDKEAYRAYVINEYGDDPFEWEEEQEEDNEIEVKSTVTLAKSLSEEEARKAKAKKKTKKKVKKTTKKPSKKIKKPSKVKKKNNKKKK